MNELLQLKGTLHQKTNNSRPGSPRLPQGAVVNVNHLEKLKRDLEELKRFWDKDNYINGALISVFYIDVIAKSRRISAYFCKGSENSNNTVVGTRFTEGEVRKHIITHYISDELLIETINKVQICINVLIREF
ncbi:MAG: hypothetical protein VB122_05680, partial [Erysipelotrichales bacterium]|nr:hypothetical protein [Erysipelotrichales bacterium]